MELFEIIREKNSGGAIFEKNKKTENGQNVSENGGE
jgi:hypothetical protein